MKKYYASKSYKIKDFYINLIKKSKSITPSFNQTYFNHLDEIQNEQEQYLNLTNEINEKLSNHYSHTFPNIAY